MLSLMLRLCWIGLQQPYQEQPAHQPLPEAVITAAQALIRLANNDSDTDSAISDTDSAISSFGKIQ